MLDHCQRWLPAEVDRAWDAPIVCIQRVWSVGPPESSLLGLQVVIAAAAAGFRAWTQLPLARGLAAVQENAIYSSEYRTDLRLELTTITSEINKPSTLKFTSNREVKAQDVDDNCGAHWGDTELRWSDVGNMV
jgi:hypothetical protein